MSIYLRQRPRDIFGVLGGCRYPANVASEVWNFSRAQIQPLQDEKRKKDRRAQNEIVQPFEDDTRIEAQKKQRIITPTCEVLEFGTLRYAEPPAVVARLPTLRLLTTAAAGGVVVVWGEV